MNAVFLVLFKVCSLVVFDILGVENEGGRGMNKWSRKKMKEIGKSRMKSNYWKAVLVGAILLLITGAGSTASTSGSMNIKHNYRNEILTETQEMQQVVSQEQTEEMAEQEQTGGNESSDQVNGNALIAGVIVAIIVLFVMAIVIAIGIFILNPIIVGGYRFFYRNLGKKAEVKEVCYAFDRRYKTIVHTMFLRDLYTLLWSCLFIVPGIIKYYEYSMIPYILAENETMSQKEAFAESKRLMKGNKWRAFVLDLSFIPWLFLSGITFGIVGVLYTCPYVHSTSAVFYQAVKEESMVQELKSEV